MILVVVDYDGREHGEDAEGGEVRDWEDGW